MEDALIFAAIVWMCAIVFIAIGIFALKKKTPMHFWVGTTVKTEEITDVEAYNKANGIMWIAYGSAFILSGILSLIFDIHIGAILVGVSSTLGLYILAFAYRRIHKKYSNKD
ncbi:MAG: hypothetical protein PHU78_08485 [Heliobacteriaceae bacterium]|nr:hypothetical protein [Heliobacteriaceae bacterium]